MLPAASARRGLPELKLDIHVYSPGSGQTRFVVLNGRRYREGESIGRKGRCTGNASRPPEPPLRQGEPALSA
jgi:hypothetical protein